MLPAPIAELPTAFRAEAEHLEPYAPPAAAAWNEAARRLEDALSAYLDAYLSPEEAEEESGYSAKHLARLAREGVIPALADGRIQRRHLPRKPGFGVEREAPARALSIASTRVQPAPSRAQVARAVAHDRKD